MTDTVIHDRNPRWMREMDNRKPRAISMGGHKKPGSTIKDRPPPGPAEVVGDIYELMNRKFHVLEARVQEVVDVVHDSNTVTNKRLTELDKYTENLHKLIGLLEDKVALYAAAELLRDHHAQLKKTRKENAKEKKEGSTWNRMKKMVSKDGIENKYIVD